jgi:hypothetical protein
MDDSSHVEMDGYAMKMRDPAIPEKDEKLKKRFNKILTIFGDEETNLRQSVDNLTRPVSQHPNMLDIKKLKRVIGRLESDSNPVNVLNNHRRVTVTCKTLSELQLQEDGFMSFIEYKQLVERAEQNADLNSEEFKIAKYLKEIEEGKKVFKWPPPWFTLSMTAIQLIIFMLHHYDIIDDEDEETLQFDARDDM